MKKNFDPLNYLHSIRLIHLSLNGHRVFKIAFENKRPNEWMKNSEKIKNSLPFREQMKIFSIATMSNAHEETFNLLIMIEIFKLGTVENRTYVRVFKNNDVNKIMPFYVKKIKLMKLLIVKVVRS